MTINQRGFAGKNVLDWHFWCPKMDGQTVTKPWAMHSMTSSKEFNQKLSKFRPWIYSNSTQSRNSLIRVFPRQSKSIPKVNSLQVWTWSRVDIRTVFWNHFLPTISLGHLHSRAVDPDWDSWNLGVKSSRMFSRTFSLPRWSFTPPPLPQVVKGRPAVLCAWLSPFL